ncbi:antitoxin [Silvibacterium acidisoli]|uniref:antitoxin n=1 Tax=Acidobacteriaceae bacterium ZG23-2 TaxID=2883246 RepID=UPI00406BFD55
MTQTRKVRLFQNGASQAVRLPADFRFQGKEIYATRDEVTGNVTLSATASSADFWDDLFERFRAAQPPEDFMTERPMNRIPDRSGVFDDELGK